MLDKDFQLEKAKAVEVQEFLDSEILRLKDLIEECKQTIKTEGEDFNMDNPNGGMYSGEELTRVHHEMEKMMQFAAEADNDIYFYKKLRNNPYFARVDFKSDATGAVKTAYIGLRTLQKHDTFQMLVCDWRAPIASLFYEDFDGKAYLEAPRGKISGDLIIKRQFKFAEGEFKYYVDSDLKIDDDILRDVLSNSTSEHLKVIVNSIQREQNKVIRYADGENLLVLGPAGSGKTSVGFHRLAYLLYQNRTELSSAEIIMFSNNDIFSGYVADIIPELGEMPINYASFYTIFNAEIPTLNVGDYYSLAESIIEGDTVREECAKIKMSKDFCRYLNSGALVFEPKFSDIRLFGETVLSKEFLTERFLSDDENSQKSRGERLAAYAQGAIDEYFVVHKKEIYEHIDQDSEVDEDTARLLQSQRRNLKQNSAAMIKNATLLDPVAVYFSALEEYAKINNLPRLLDTKASLSRGWLEFEDALGVVYTKTVLGTCAVLSGVKHILIDEAQDFAPIQHKIILKMFPRAKFTLLADTNQAIVHSLNITSGDEISRIYGAKTLHLDKSYRSTKEINKFALGLLPEDRRYNVFNRDGEAVDVITGGFEELKATLENYEKLSRSTCIVALTATECAKLYKKLKKDFPSLRLCDNKGCSLENAPIIMPLTLTKGLEFDNVIVWDKDGCFKQNSAYLYMAATRALHRLTVIEN